MFSKTVTLHSGMTARILSVPHADSEILLSFPGLGPMLGARVLTELGDARTRFADARALKSYAGSAPITRTSGKKRFVGRRFVKNNRLINAGFFWAFAALTASPPHRLTASPPHRLTASPPHRERMPTTGADASMVTGMPPHKGIR
jgi:hypothetical protein